MGDYGPVEFGYTKYKNECVLYKSRSKEGYTYEFNIKRRAKKSARTTWKCSACHELRNRDKTLGVVPVLTTEDGVFVSDPETPPNPHFCQPRKHAEVMAGQYRHCLTTELQFSGKRPHESYKEILVDAAHDYSDRPALRDEVQHVMAPFKKLKPALYRAYNQKFPVINDIGSIPNKLKLTVLGSADDPRYGEGYVIFQQAEPPFLILASQQDLAVLHQSRHWVMDGTFKYCPKDLGFAQLYVIFGFANGESLAVVHALMPNKQIGSYNILFSTIRNALIQNHGCIGAVEFGHFDFETAALSSFKANFHEVVVKGCAFHFAQAINRKITEVGLKPVYEQSKAQHFEAPQYAFVYNWIRRIVALCLLGPGLVKPHWDRTLKHPPNMGIQMIDQALGKVSHYVETQWLKSVEQIHLFNHWGNNGPRTNNHAEGYNSSLREKFKHPNMKLSHFLVEFQQQHHEIQMRASRLLAGGPPTPRDANSVDADAAIEYNKQIFQQQLKRIRQDQDFERNLDTEIADYLDHVQNFLH